MSSNNDSETILSVLSCHVNERPDHELFLWVDEKANVTNSLSYKELWHNSCAVAQLLEAKDVKKGDRVMIAYPFGLEFLAGLVGCMMTGVIGCSVYPPNPRQLHIDLPAFNLKVRDAGAKFALTTSKFKRFMGLNKFIGNMSEVTWLATDGLGTPSSGWRSRLRLNDVSPNDVAFIQYTSGSTGFPKGVVISQGSLVYNARYCAECSKALSLSDLERSEYTCVSWMPQYHDMGLIGAFFMTMYGGSKLVSCSPLDFMFNPILWHDLMIKYRARTSLGPNFSFGMLVKRLQGRKRPFEKWTFVERLVCAAEPVDRQVMDQVVNVLGIQPSVLHIGFGLAEVGLAVCFGTYSVRDGLVACGDLVDEGAEVCIVDDSNKKVEDGTVGEVFVHSPKQVALGYWGNSEATKSTFSCHVENMAGDWLATGDLGKVEDDKLYITGRKKEVIILNGRNVFPVDIERVVERAYPLVIRPGCVAAYQHSSEGVGVVADLRKGVKKEDRPQVLHIVNMIAQECQVATLYVCLLKVHSVPKTTSGKIKRVEVKEMSIDGSWPRRMVELEWHKPPTTGSAQKITPLTRSSLAIGGSVSDVSVPGVMSKSEFVTVKKTLGGASCPSFSIREDAVLIADRNAAVETEPQLALLNVDASSKSISSGDQTSEYETLLALIESQVGRTVEASDRLQDLGLTSLSISSLHASLQDRYGVTDEELPVSAFFQGKTLVGDLAEKILLCRSSLQQDIPSRDGVSYKTEPEVRVEEMLLPRITDHVTKLFSNELGREVDATVRLGDLGLTSLTISSIHASIVESFALAEDNFPVSILLEGHSTIDDIIVLVHDACKKLVRNDIQEFQYARRHTDETRRRRPHSQHFFDEFVSFILQLIAIVFQGLFLSCTVFLPTLCTLVALKRYGSGAAILFVLPLNVHLHALVSAVLLIILKWTLVGRQREGHVALWSSRFAARWIVRQCSQLVWNYSLWNLSGGMEIMNVLYRLLGCKVGSGASLSPGCVEDYDLVEIGSGTSVGAAGGTETVLHTSTVSLGVLSLSPVVIGSNCTISEDCLLERGTTLDDGVFLEIRTHVKAFSELQKGTSWHGKPAEQIVLDNDIETGSSANQHVESITERLPESWLSFYGTTRFFTVFVLAPCLWALEFGIMVLIGFGIFRSLGWLGLCGLLWVPPTMVYGVTFPLAIVAKKILLGRVQAGVWPRSGSFHARKYFVDHLVQQHALRWKGYSTNVGSYIAGSRIVDRFLLRSLGVKIGTSTYPGSGYLWTSYDLLSVGSRCQVGGLASCYSWRTRGGAFIGSMITISDDVFVGAVATVFGGVHLSKGCTVASYSIVKKDVGNGETVVGTKTYQTAISEVNGEDWKAGLREISVVIGMFGVWTGISAFAWMVGLVATKSSLVDWGGLTAVERSALACFAFGSFFIIAVPSYLIFMMWVGKMAIIGSFTPAEMPNSSYRTVPLVAFGAAFVEQYLSYTSQSFAGTFVENTQWTALGAQIGAHVYLDGVYMFEPDLVRIGEWTSILRHTVLTCHQVERRARRYSPITIGKRCTIGTLCNVQLASLDDDTEMMGMSMSLCGSRVKSGSWVGYPARRVGPASQTPRPPQSAWIALLFSPWSTLLGCLWFLTLPLKPVFAMLCMSKRREPLGQDIPEALRGTFVCDDSDLKLTFEAAEWYERLRILRVSAGEYMAPHTDESRVDRWWVTASYEFDLSNGDEHIGRVSLGWWRVPMSIVTAKLRHDGNHIVWCHSWFGADAEDEMRFKQIAAAQMGGRSKKQI